MGSSHKGPAAVASWNPCTTPASTLWQSLARDESSRAGDESSADRPRPLPAVPRSRAASQEPKGTGMVYTQPRTEGLVHLHFHQLAGSQGRHALGTPTRWWTLHKHAP